MSAIGGFVTVGVVCACWVVFGAAIGMFMGRLIDEMGEDND